MGKKKNKSKKKIANMSDEERARYLQHRADIEEEAKRRKQQLIALFMKNKLKREEEFSRLNLAKLNQEWRTILRQVKCNELEVEISDIEKHFQDTFQRKEKVIQRLLNDLREADEFYLTLQESHTENIDKLINIYDRRLNYWKEDYFKSKDTILANCSNEFEYYHDIQNSSSQRLAEICFQQSQNDIKNSNYAEEKHITQVVDIKSEMTIKLEDIIKLREEQIQSLWDTYRYAVIAYSEHIETFYADYASLRERDTENSTLIRINYYQAEKLTDKLAELKSGFDKMTEEYNLNVSKLTEQEIYLKSILKTMKNDFELKHKSYQVYFKQMVVASQSTILTLQKILKRGEYLLQLATICQKLETENEKFIGPKIINEIPDKKVNENLRPSIPDFKEDLINRWKTFENFWNNVNRARLDCACLQEEKLILENQNKKLKSELKNYLIDSTLTGTVKDRIINRRPSSMSIIKVTQNEYQRRGRPQTSYIEGNLSNAVRAKKILDLKNERSKGPKIEVVIYSSRNRK